MDWPWKQLPDYWCENQRTRKSLEYAVGSPWLIATLLLKQAARLTF